MGVSWGSTAPPCAHGTPVRDPKAVRKGILKRQPASNVCQSRRGFFLKWRRGGRSVTFQKKIRVQEYSRVLDGGDTVPGDGCKVSLGLGKKLRSYLEPLAKAPGSSKKPVEETAWLPGPQRERLLRKAMGNARYMKAWLRHRREVMQTLRSREESRADENDQFLMPCPKEARERALQMHEEAVEIAAEIKASAKVGARVEEKKTRRRASFAPALGDVDVVVKAADKKQRKRSPTPPVRRRRPSTAAPPAGAGEADVGMPPCHTCGKHTATGPVNELCMFLERRSSEQLEQQLEIILAAVPSMVAAVSEA